MKANKYKTLYSFQKESIKYLKSRNLALTKIDKICNLLNKKVKKFEFEFDGFKINSNKNLKNNKFVSILLQYSNNLVKIIQEDDKKENNLYNLAYNDTLTGLKNKNSLQSMLKTDIRKYQLLLLNVDNFSYVNTAYGCDSGDVILIKIAQMLKTICNHDCLYRINADEFGIVYKTDINMLQLIIKIQKYFYKNAIVVENLTFHVTFTYGGAIGKYTLFKKATVALKEAKQSGNNRYKIYHEGENVIEECQLTEFVHWNNIIFDAIKNSEIIPFFQGIYDNKTKKINKFEALVRIKHKNGYYTPNQFLETAKLSGVLPKITKEMVKKTFKIMSKNSYDFSLNITEEDLDQNFLLDFLPKMAKKYSIEHKRVALEILEGISAATGKNHIKQLKKLQDIGFFIAIDDFGTEYSNFERLLVLDIDYIKLDAKYIKNIDTNKRSRDVVEAIVFFAKRNNLPCIAEFVHNKSVAKIVKNLGIEYSQGYYYSKPQKKLP